MARRLLGVATTDGSGVARLEYTGQGLGKLDIQAETVGSVLFEHIGVGGTETDNFGYTTDYVTESADSTGTTVTCANSSSQRLYFANKTGSSTGSNYDWESYNLVAEMDIINGSGNISFTISDGSCSITRSFSQLHLTNGGHLRVVCDGSKVEFFVDNATQPVYSATSNFSGLVGAQFALPNNTSFKYKNFYLYENVNLVQSNVYELIDAKFVQTGKTTGWYQTTLSLEDNRLKWVFDSSSNQYVSLRGSSINSLIGQTFNTCVKISSSKTVGLAVYYQDTSVSYNWTNVALQLISDTEEHTLEATIPSNATNIWIRLQTSSNSLSNNDVVYIDKFIIY